MKFRATAIMETDLVYEFELTADEYKAAIAEWGSLRGYVKDNVDGGLFYEDPNCYGDWVWGDVMEVTP